MARSHVQSKRLERGFWNTMWIYNYIPNIIHLITLYVDFTVYHQFNSMEEWDIKVSATVNSTGLILCFETIIDTRPISTNVLTSASRWWWLMINQSVEVSSNAKKLQQCRAAYRSKACAVSVTHISNHPPVSLPTLTCYPSLSEWDLEPALPITGGHLHNYSTEREKTCYASNLQPSDC